MNGFRLHSWQTTEQRLQMDKKVIATKRLTLRPIQPGDEKAIHEYAGDKCLTMMYC